MGEIEELVLDLSQTSDARLADVLVEVSDELTARGARYAPDGQRYATASILVDKALEELKAQIREDS